MARRRALDLQPAVQLLDSPSTEGGGTARSIATTANGVISVSAMAVAGGSLIWEEDGVGPAALDGSVGSKIIKVSLAGGAATTVVNGMENGLIVPPGPGYIPASWHPRGGIVPDSGVIYFADADFFQSYGVMSVADTGGVINILLADTTHDGSDFVRSMTSDATTLYWVDLNRVRSMAKAGGAVADLAGPRTIPPWSLTRQGSDLYWIEATCCAHRDKGTIYTVPTTGGAPNQGTPLEGTPPLTPRKFSAPPPRTPSTARHSAPAATRSLARPHGSAIPGLFAR